MFRGFTAEEFNERSIEIVIGGVTSSRGRHPVVGGIRLSNGVGKQFRLKIIYSRLDPVQYVQI